LRGKLDFIGLKMQKKYARRKKVAEEFIEYFIA
jgi:hypothetical protein